MWEMPNKLHQSGILNRKKKTNKKKHKPRDIQKERGRESNGDLKHGLM